MKNTLKHWEKRYGEENDLERWKSEWRMNFYTWAGESIKKEKCTIADFGSGLGYGLQILKQKNPNWIVTGIDFSTNACEKAVIPTECKDILKETIEKKWDYVLCIQTLEHFKEPEIVLKELLKITKTKLIITVPYKENITNHTEHEYSFTRKFFHGFDKPVLTEVQKKYKRIKAVIYKNKKEYRFYFYIKELFNIFKEKIQK